MSELTLEDLTHIVESDTHYSDLFNLNCACLRIIPGFEPGPVNSQIEGAYENILNHFCSCVYERLSANGAYVDTCSLLLFFDENRLMAPEINELLPSTGVNNERACKVDFDIAFSIATGDLDQADDYLGNNKTWLISKVTFLALIGETRKKGKVPRAREVFTALPRYDLESIIDTIENDKVTWTTRKGKKKTTSFEDISERISKFKSTYPHLLLMR